MLDKLIYAAVGLLVGAGVGAAGAYMYLQDEFAAQQRAMMTLHGSFRAVACQQPESQRPKGIDCRGLVP